MSVESSEILSDKMDGLTMNEEGISVKIKRPKRVLHFSDGVMEEYSTDDEPDAKDADVVDNDDSNKVIDESKLNWGPWLSLKAWKAGSSVLAGCDYVGETLASVLGITSNKYSYEMEQFKKMQQRAAEQEREDKEAGTFMEKTNLNEGDAACITDQEQIKKY